MNGSQKKAQPSASTGAALQSWEKSQAGNPEMVADVPITRYWLIPAAQRPKMPTPHPPISMDEIRERTQGVWYNFYSLGSVWARSRCVSSIKGRLTFVPISRLYRQMYAKTGISTDSARRRKSNWLSRLIAKPCRMVFQAKPMPELKVPVAPSHVAGVVSAVKK
jgi:hypothetical protein